MRVLSMQGKEVWDILQRDKVYHADISKAREKADYKEDIEQLGGKAPIWCFYYPEFSFDTVYNGELLEELRCEMSLHQDNCWDEFLLFELEIPKSALFIGKHHNGNSKCKVFGELLLSDVYAVYTVRDADRDGWYFKVLSPIYAKNANVITTKTLDCSYWDSVEDTYTGLFIESDAGRCLKCGKETVYTWLGKHYCCLAHLWKHKSQVIRTATIRGQDIDEALHKYERSRDTDYNVK